jgi:DNA polymerase III epsilon subunit-like protein
VTLRAFFDCETSGLDSEKNQILTFALVIDDDGVIVFEREWKVAQTSWAVIDDYALKVNKIDLVAHNASAVDEGVFVRELTEALAKNRVFGSTPYGHNLAFDIGFLRAACRRASRGFPFGYHYGDSMVFALALRDAGLIGFRSAKLEELCAFFGIAGVNYHTALDDTRATRALYLELLKTARRGVSHGGL